MTYGHSDSDFGCAKVFSLWALLRNVCAANAALTRISRGRETLALRASRCDVCAAVAALTRISRGR